MANNTQKAVLLLQDGTVFYGKAAGFTGICTGEICFNTGMTGYQEIFTDPSYANQILVMTNVHIGNYGCKTDESESGKLRISGLVCRNFSDHFSRLNTDISLDDYFKENKICCIYDVDTRALVQHVRQSGAMNALISTETMDLSILRNQLALVPDMLGLELASSVSTREAYEIGNPSARIKVAAIDFGIKSSILNQLQIRDLHIKVFPAKVGFDELETWNPNAYFLSNGPGDPSVMSYALQTCKQIIQSQKPLFGICLGHQIIGLTLGAKATKMLQGHRGSNHPVKNLLTGRGEITSQNHGFTLDMDSVLSLKDNIELTHVNLNDHSVEGIKHRSKPIFSVQYHPEAGPGPHDSRYLFDRFTELIHNVYGF